jgi:wyosine [tRNA(Phe)-imidazoG37] synthetase (radical SAM superfamily)
MKKHDIVFGPILSRRLGRSLGIDPIMRNICCQDCIYCEAGKTEILTLKRDEYVPFDNIISELDKVLKDSPELDYITFSGLGEPTLNLKIGDVIRHLKKNYPQHPVCLLTNGMLLGDPQVQQDVADVDLVIPSLDASNAEEFARINRPGSEMDFDTFITGLAHFTHIFKGKIYLELFIVPGINDSDESIARFAEIIRTMRLDKIQLNALDRPGTENDIVISSSENAARFSAVLGAFAQVEFVGRGN